MSADQGNSVARYNLGKMLEYGLGVSQDYAAAALLYEKAAREGQGSVPAEYKLGVFYENGYGYKWLIER